MTGSSRSPMEQLVERMRNAKAPSNVAAVMVGLTSEPDADDLRWHVLISDGATTAEIDVTRPSTAAAMSDEQVIARVEQAAADVMSASRLADFLAGLDHGSPNDGTLVLGAD